MTSATGTRPSLRVERALQRAGHRIVAGMDEVGRGALAGPVSVGVVAIAASCPSAPQGVKDSKLLTPRARAAMVPQIERWALGWAVGHASPAEIDEWGIMVGLRLAGQRAVQECGVRPDIVLLDGNHDWLSDTRPPLLWDSAEIGAEQDGEPITFGSSEIPVRTLVKADLTCSSVAAASVLAKVTRDTLMVRRSGDHPQYGWDANKGYASPMHVSALREHGSTEHHRRSWNLTGTSPEGERREC